MGWNTTGKTEWNHWELQDLLLAKGWGSQRYAEGLTCMLYWHVVVEKHIAERFYVNYTFPMSNLIHLSDVLDNWDVYLWRSSTTARWIPCVNLHSFFCPSSRCNSIFSHFFLVIIFSCVSDATWLLVMSFSHECWPKREEGGVERTRCSTSVRGVPERQHARGKPEWDADWIQRRWQHHWYCQFFPKLEQRLLEHHCVFNCHLFCFWFRSCH